MGGRGNARVKWGQEVNDDEFQEVMVNHHQRGGRKGGGGEDTLLPRRVKSGGGYKAAAVAAGPNGPSGLPSIGQSNSYPNSTSGTSSRRQLTNQAYNMAGVSPPTYPPPTVQPGRATSAGLHGRVDWKAKYLK